MVFSVPFLPEGALPKTPTDIILLLALELVVCVAVLGFTARSSVLRWGALPVVTLPALLISSRALDIMPRLLLSQVPAAYACTWWTQYLVSALLLQENFADGGPPATRGHNKARGSDTLFNRVLFGLNVVNSQRNVGTPQQAPHLPPFSRSDPTWVPSRARFLLTRGLLTAFSFLVIDVLTSEERSVADNPVLFAELKVPLFRRWTHVTADELQLRAITSIGQWVALYFVVTLLHSAMAFTTVLLRFYAPADWPPLFGSVLDIYSLRQFWGRFWHAMMRYKLVSAADAVAFDVLRLRRGALTTRYAHLFFVFAASGLCHLQMDAISPMPWYESRAMQFFLMQAVGITFEDAVQATYRHVAGQRRNKAGLPPVWARLFGFAWTVAWLVWTTPQWVYPGARHAIGGEKARFLPVSVVKALFP